MPTRAPRRRRNPAPVVFVAPFLLLFLLTFALPIGYAVYQSVMDVEHTGALGLGGSHTVFAGCATTPTRCPITPLSAASVAYCCSRPSRCR